MHKIRKNCVTLMSAGFLSVSSLSSVAVLADQAPASAMSSPGPTSAVAQTQVASAPDSELARMIERTIANDTSLSRDAHHVKVTAVDGKVSLRGEVKDAAEKWKVESVATKIAGPHSVNSALKEK